MKKMTFLFAFGLVATFLVSPVSGDHCKGKHKNDLGCPGTEGIPYSIQYNFEGEISDSGDFDAAVVCTSQYCEFNVDDLAFEFNLPASYLNQFNGAQAICFPPGTLAHSVAFRSGHGGQDWHGHVEVEAFTQAGEATNYTFHLGGPCNESENPVCPLLPAGVGSLLFSGELLYVDLPTRGKGKRSAAGCTCAWDECPAEDDITLSLAQGEPE